MENSGAKLAVEDQSDYDDESDDNDDAEGSEGTSDARESQSKTNRDNILSRDEESKAGPPLTVEKRPLQN